MSQFNATTFSIDRPTGQCAFTGRELEPGEDYIATLVETDSDETAAASEGGTASTDSKIASAEINVAPDLGFRRLDVSLEAWEQGNRPDRVFAHWKAEVPQPNERKKVFVDNDVLLNLLRRLADADAPDRIAFRFVLALILMRKKMVRYDRTELRAANAKATANTTDDSAQVNEEATDDQQTKQEWWLLTPKLDPAKGPMGKWHDEEIIEVMNPHLTDDHITRVTEQLGEILNGEL